jgi:hypothetical protein
LLIAKKNSPEGEHDGAHESPGRADYKELSGGHGSQSKDITKIILRKSRYQKKNKDQYFRPPVFQKIVIPFNRFFLDKFFDKGSSEGLREKKSEPGTKN